VVAFLLVMVAAAAVVLVVSSPFRRAETDTADAVDPKTATKVADLEAAKESKYREIRDAELDHRMGKLSDEDFASTDHTLRAEAIDIIDALDRSEET
jgi:hypothetical protein